MTAAPDPDWLQIVHRHLLALSEGLCPDHQVRLRLTGWCPRCQAWWSASFPAGEITVRYPFPGLEDPEP